MLKCFSLMYISDILFSCIGTMVQINAITVIHIIMVTAVFQLFQLLNKEAIIILIFSSEFQR